MHEHFHGPLGGPAPSLEEMRKRKFQMLVVIVDRVKKQQVTELLQEKHIHMHFILFGEGTASSEIMDLLGLGTTEKAITLSIAPRDIANRLLESLDRKLNLARPGNGIAFTVPLSGVSSPVLQLLDKDIRDTLRKDLEREVDKMSTGAKYDLILAVINQGCSEDLMDAAKTGGATGGTVLHARRISSEDSVKFFGIAIQAEKELVAILTTREKKNAIMKAIGQSCGMRSDSKGIFISVPVDSIAGMPVEMGMEETDGE